MSTPCGALSARNRVLEVLPRSGFTFDHHGGDAYLYAWVGNSGPSVTANWDNGTFTHGRVGKRSYQTEQGFLNALSRMLARQEARR
jgi:hypothetical protein